MIRKKYLVPVIFFLTIFIAITIVSLVFSYISLHSYKTTALILPDNKKITLQISDTSQKQVLGLSYRKKLPQDEAMLFVFQQPDYIGIWMKDMNFPLDIFWLNGNFQVIYIEQNANPASYPEVFKPATPAVYVLEANAGFAEQNHITLGTKLDILKP